MDYNNNGRVERNEWYGGAAEFRRLDANHDGILTRYEVVGSSDNFTTYNEFTSLDYDRNGSLDRPEWHWSNASFNARDTNRDGRITAQEFETAGGSPSTAKTQTVGHAAGARQLAGALDRHRHQRARGRRHHL